MKGNEMNMKNDENWIWRILTESLWEGFLAAHIHETGPQRHSNCEGPKQHFNFQSFNMNPFKNLSTTNFSSKSWILGLGLSFLVDNPF